MPLDADLKVLLDFLAERDQPPMSAGTPDEARAAFRRLVVDLRDPAKVHAT